MAEAEMYPLTDYPNYRHTSDDFADLRYGIESQPEGLNFVVAWSFYDEQDEDYEPGDLPRFAVLVFMPRKTATTEFSTREFNRAEVEAWLAGYVRERTMRWYGWADPVTEGVDRG